MRESTKNALLEQKFRACDLAVVKEDAHTERKKFFVRLVQNFRVVTYAVYVCDRTTLNIGIVYTLSLINVKPLVRMTRG